MTSAPTTTADAVIELWSEKMAPRLRGHNETYDRAAHASRSGFYETPPSFDQYLALCAYLDTMELRVHAFESPQEARKALKGTFGGAYPDLDGAALEAVLDDHFRAMTRAYELETTAALEGLTP